MGAKYIKDSEELEDYCQEVFLKIYESLSTFRGEAEFSTWVYRIARNLITKQAKKQKVLKVQDHNLFDNLPICRSYPPQQNHPIELSETLDRKEELKSKVLNLLSSLPHQYKTPLVLYYFENLSYKEISDKLNLKLNTLKSYIHRGKELLKDFIHEWERKKNQGVFLRKEGDYES